MTPQRAYLIASQWGSYMHAGDPGACFYGFHPGDGRPQSEEHRQACLAYADRCKAIATAQGDKRDARELEAFKTWMQSAPLNPGA